MPFLGQLIGYFTWLLTTAELNIIKFFAWPSWATVSIELKWYWVVAAYVILVLFLARSKKTEGADER